MSAGNAASLPGGFYRVAKAQLLVTVSSAVALEIIESTRPYPPAPEFGTVVAPVNAVTAAQKEEDHNMAAKVLVFCGSDEPQKAFPPFMLGTGALATDMEVTLFFTMNGLNIVRKGGAERILLPGAPKTLPEFVQIAREGGAKMIACSATFPVVGIQEEDLIEGVECGGVATFVIAAEESDVVLTF